MNLRLTSVALLGLLHVACGGDAEGPAGGAGGTGSGSGGAGAGAGVGTGGADGTGGGASGSGGAGLPPIDPDAGFGLEIEGGETKSGFALIDLTIEGDAYKVTTNPWGGADQTIAAGDGVVFTVVSMSAPAGGQAWDVAAFPSVFRGASYGGDRTADSGMPIQISAIQAVETGLSTNASAINYKGNTTYDVYFTNSQDYNLAGEGPPDVYLMVWFDANAINPINSEGEGWSCGSEPPTYIEACTGAGSVDIDGKTFHRFIGPNGDATVISYAPEERFDEWEFDLNDFITDAVAEGVLTEDMYLQSVQGGFELIEGGAGLSIYDYYVHVNP